MKTISDLLTITRQTTPTNIMNVIQIRYRQPLEYQAVNKVKHALLGDTLEHERELFQQLPAYFRRIQQTNPDAYTYLSIDD